VIKKLINKLNFKLFSYKDEVLKELLEVYTEQLNMLEREGDIDLEDYLKKIIAIIEFELIARSFK
jgi:hypothetical protein